MKDRVLGAVDLLLGRSIEAAEAVDGKFRLELRGKDGDRESFEADHVIAATGFRTSLERLAFLSGDLRSAIRTEDETPVLYRNYESSVDGGVLRRPRDRQQLRPDHALSSPARDIPRAS